MKVSYFRAKLTHPCMQVLVATSSPAPNPNCIVCGRAEVVLTTNVHIMTLQQLLDKVCGVLSCKCGGSQATACRRPPSLVHVRPPQRC